jgi:NTE family protein
VVFDSYEKEDGTRKSEYGKYIVQVRKEVGFAHTIMYNDGITADHVIASASVPLNFDYTPLEVESYNYTTFSYEKNIRYFWDGGIMSNTPLTQVVWLHRDYWLKTKGFKDTVPRLNIIIINVHPAKQETIPWNRDDVINRKDDITFSDRTEREEQALLLVSDYVDLARKLIKIAKDHGAKDDIINNLLNSNTINHGLAIRPRKYYDILIGQYEIGEVYGLTAKVINTLYQIKYLTFLPKRLIN